MDSIIIHDELMMMMMMMMMMMISYTSELTGSHPISRRSSHAAG
jgi:hypothetical protein